MVNLFKSTWSHLFQLFLLLLLIHLSPNQTVAQLLHVCSVRWGFPGQDASMDSRMQGLHPASQHLWVSSQLWHIPDIQSRGRLVQENTQNYTTFWYNMKGQAEHPPDRESSITQSFGCTTWGDQRQPHIHQPLGKPQQVSFVWHTQKCCEERLRRHLTDLFIHTKREVKLCF